VRTVLLLFAMCVTAGICFAETITTTTSGAGSSFNLTPGSNANPGSGTITANTNWSLSPPYDMYVYAYFLSSTAALTDGAGHNIPASAFYLSDNGGPSTAVTSSSAFNAGFGGLNAGLQLDYVNVQPVNKTGSVADAMAFNLDLSGITQLPAGTYTGTLYIQSQGVKGGNRLNSGPQAVTLTATLAESLTVALSGSSVKFTLTPGTATNAGNASVAVTTSWVMRASRTSIGLYAYFATASAALTDGAGDSIPSSAFLISDNGAPSTALATTVPFGAANAGLQLASVPVTSTNENSRRTDNLSFNIDLTGGALPQLPAGTYTGTLYIQAQTTP